MKIIIIGILLVVGWAVSAQEQTFQYAYAILHVTLSADSNHMLVVQDSEGEPLLTMDTTDSRFGPRAVSADVLVPFLNGSDNPGLWQITLDEFTGGYTAVAGKEYWVTVCNHTLFVQRKEASAVGDNTSWWCAMMAGMLLTVGAAYCFRGWS